MIGAKGIDFLGHTWSLRGLFGVHLYFAGMAGEVLMLTSIYMLIPAGRRSW